MKTSRRKFARVLTAIPLVSAADLLGQASLESKSTALSTAMTEVVRAQFGQHLDSNDVERIAKDFQDYATFIEDLRKFPLTNADVPDFRIE